MMFNMCSINKNVFNHNQQKELSLFPSHLITKNNNDNIYHGDHHILLSSSYSCNIYHSNNHCYTDWNITGNDNEEEVSLYPSYLIQSQSVNYVETNNNNNANSNSCRH